MKSLEKINKVRKAAGMKALLTRKELTARRRLYRNFKADTCFSWCWACGRDESQRPDRWFAEWWLDRAHIVHSPRVEDVRLIVLLCRLCHGRFSGAHIVGCNGHDWPKLTIANLLWLKRKFDPANYDRAFLQDFSIQRLPRAIKPPAVYLTEYRGRHPG
jgi:hypothetical protein